jgi:hypothetical protein
VTLQARIDRILDSFRAERPKNMIKLPGYKDPDVLTQLAEYSIASDIHLYEIPP